MKHLSPTDPVPALRGDVVFSRRPTGSGAEVIYIRPIGYGESTRLHGFELSLARLLDGRRTAQDVVRRAARIGLPLTLPSLEGFIRYLQSHELLSRTMGEAASAISPWSERSEWDELVRQHYRSALEAIRAGRADDARLRLDRLLSLAPQVSEARSLREWLADHPAGIEDGEAFEETFAKVQAGWVSEPDQLVPLAREELRAVRRSWVPAAVLLAVILAALALLLVPLPRVVSAPGELQPITVTPLDAPADVTVREVQVEEGDRVLPGDPLLSFNEGSGLTAPVAGTVTDVRVLPGLYVAAGAPLLELGDTRRLTLTANLDPVQAAEVQPGQTVTVALGTRRVKTRVEALSGDTVTTTVDNAAGLMEPGAVLVDIDVGAWSVLQRMLR